MILAGSRRACFCPPLTRQRQPASPQAAGTHPQSRDGQSGDLGVPRPLRLLVTAGWNLTESVGLPAAAYVLAAWLGGRDAGLVAGLAAIWLTAVIRKVATGSVPSLLTISAVVLTAQTAVVLATGELWLFLLQFPLANLCMCVLFARTASGPNPLVARLAAEVVALRQPATPHPGLHRFFQGATWLWAGIFLLLAAGLALYDGHRAGHDVPDALDRRDRRARSHRDRRVRTVVLLGAAQARAEAPFRSSLSPAAATGSPEHGASRPPCSSAPEPPASLPAGRSRRRR